jgi:hypothetical protein
MPAAPEGRLRPSSFFTVVALTDGQIALKRSLDVLGVAIERMRVSGIVFGNGMTRSHPETNRLQDAL